jgi:hypothetical protein
MELSRLVPHLCVPVRFSRSEWAIHDKPSQMSFTVDFEWAVDAAGYDWVAGGPADESDEKSLFGEVVSVLHGKPVRPARIVGRGGELRIYRPFERASGLFLPFSKLARTEEGLLEFVSRYGPMTREGMEASGEDASIGLSHAEAISEFLSEYRTDPHNCFAKYERGLGWSRMDVALTFNASTGQPQMIWRPSSFVNALWFELAASLTGNTPLRACRYCGKWFWVGPGTGRRLDAKFCSDQHRKTFNSLKRTASEASHA